MRILIVGCGYIGLPLGAELARHGHEVFGLRRSALAAAEMQAAGITPLQADVTQPESLAQLPRDFDWVVNCTASGGGEAEHYRKIYLEGNRNLLVWLAGMPLKKFIYTSSTSVYAQSDGSWVTEKSGAEPEAATAKVLREAEKVLLAAVESDFPAVILRVAGIYGPGRGHAFRQFLRGEARLAGDGARWLNMIQRDDVIGAIVAALLLGKPGEIYNAADNLPVSQRDFFGWLAQELQMPMLPANDASVEERRKRGVTNKQICNLKLRTELNYEFKFPDFRVGYGAEIAQLNQND